MLEIFLAHVEERLPGHRRVALALFFRHKVEHRFHQRTLARRGRGLHHDGQRLRQQTRHGGEIAYFLVRLFTHCAASLEVGKHSIQQARIAQQFHCG